MNLIDEGESSGMFVQPAKRRRGRPRKYPSLKQAEAAHTPSSEGGIGIAHLSQRADRTKETESMVGQSVTGVVEASFDSGYLLTVRIGNSSTNLRGVVFKPGHCAPITAQNDVAPHVQMIKRSDVHFNFDNQSQTPVVPSKRKYAPSGRAPAAPPASNVTPVAPQPISYPNGSQDCNNGDADVHMVEPLSMLPPGRSIPVGQVSLPVQPYPSCQVAQGSQQHDNGSFNKGTPTDIDAKSSSQTSDTKLEESLKSSPENSAVVSELDTGIGNEPFPTETPRTEPLCNYGAGRMTELLKVLQENSKETQVQVGEQPTSATQVEFEDTVP